jgi:hypothetical protein
MYSGKYINMSKRSKISTKLLRYLHLPEILVISLNFHDTGLINITENVYTLFL